MRYLALLLPFLATSAFAKSDAVLLEKEPSSLFEDWSFEYGVAFITKNSIGDIFSGEIARETGDAGGELYQLTATKHLASLKWDLFGRSFTPQLELPLCLEIVDENARSPFLDYNASLQLRWVDFPWNETIKTSFGVGLGLSYSTKIYQMDYQRHPGEDRSHLKFNLPIHLAFALPEYPDQELLIYLAHQSGGFHIFDKGGVNSLGIGLRHRF